MVEGELLLKRLLSSDAKAELLTLFRANPGLVDGIDGVARRIGRTRASVEPEVEDLKRLGILSKRQVGKIEVLFLDRQKDAEVQKAVERYLSKVGRSF